MTVETTPAPVVEVVAAPPPETPETPAPAPAPAPEEKKDLMGPRFAALTKKEKAVFEAEQAVKAREAKIAEEAARVARFEKAQKSFADGDWDGVIEHLGANDGEQFERLMKGLTQVALRKKDLPPEVVEAQRALREIKAEREAEKKAAEEAAKKAEEERLAATKRSADETKAWWLENHASKYIKENAEKLEVLAHSVSSETQRAQVLEAIWKRTEEIGIKADQNKEPRDIDKWLAMAAEEVEDKLTRLYGEELKSVSALKKFQQPPPPKTEAAEPITTKEVRAAALRQMSGPPANPRPVSLTNSVQAAPVREDSKDESPEACFDRALKML